MGVGIATRSDEVHAVLTCRGRVPGLVNCGVEGVEPRIPSVGIRNSIGDNAA